MKMRKLSKGAIVQAKNGTVYEITNINLSTKPYILKGKLLPNGQETTLKFKDLEQVLKNDGTFLSLFDSLAPLTVALVPVLLMTAILKAILPSQRLSSTSLEEILFVRGLV